jgi:hypothetical protein
LDSSWLEVNRMSERQLKEILARLKELEAIQAKLAHALQRLQGKQSVQSTDSAKRPPSRRSKDGRGK